MRVAIPIPSFRTISLLTPLLPLSVQNQNLVGMNKFLFLTTTVALLVSMANADTFQVKFNIANLDGKKGNKGSFVMEINQEWVSGNIICMCTFAGD